MFPRRCFSTCVSQPSPNNHLMRERRMRLLMIFCPFAFSLILSMIGYVLLMSLYMILPMMDAIESYLVEQEIGILKMQSHIEKINVALSFQRVTTLTQMQGEFNKVLNLYSAFEDVVAWEDQDLDYKATAPLEPQKKNVMITSEYQMDEFCDMRALCQNDQSCLADYDLYLNQYDYYLTDIVYRKSQYIAWNWDNSTNWYDLQEEQKKFIILSSFLLSINKAATLNRINEDLQITDIYYGRSLDSIALFYGLGNRLTNMQIINTNEYGGPFTCDKINGEYQKYKYSSVDQFNGFQYYDYNDNYCGNQTSNGLCSCEFNNYKRVFPVDWRCRPWFVSSNSSYSASFADPFISLRTNEQMTTCSFKIIDDLKYPNVSLQDQMNIKADSVVTTQVDFTQLQSRNSVVIENGVVQEYEYIVAPKQFNYDLLNGYYQHTAITHPFIKLGQKNSIIDLEYGSSLYKEEEIAIFMENTPFLQETTLKKNDCDSIFNLTIDQNYYKMNKNGTQYIYIFSELSVCTGNMYEQISLTVGYLTRAVQVEYAKRYSQNIKQKMFDIMIFFLIIETATFIFIFFFLYNCTYHMLIVNFEKPIEIVNNFLNEADAQTIEQFNNLVETKQLKTQYEIQNLIKAIYDAVVSIQTQVSNYLNSNLSQFFSQERVLEAYKKGLQDYQVFKHSEGIGMCSNNIASLLLIKQKYSESLFFMQKAYLLSESLFDQKIQQSGTYSSYNDMFRKLCKTTNDRNFMQIYASRKLQLANILFIICETQYLEEFHYFSEYFITEKTRKYSSVLQQRRSFQKTGIFESPRSQKIMSFEKIDKFDESLQRVMKCQQDESYFQKNTVNRELFFSEKFFFKQVLYNSKYDEDHFKSCERIMKDKKSLLTQAIDLLQEAYLIFKFLYEARKKEKNSDITRSKKIYLKSILTLIIHLKCEILFTNRILIIQSISTQIKKKLKKAMKNPSFHSQELLFVLQQKYYNCRGQFFQQNNNDYKALASYIKALNYRWNYKMKEMPYDSFEASKSLIAIQQIIGKRQIKLTPEQRGVLEKDLTHLNQQSLINDNEQLYFLEVLFSEEKQFHKRHSIHTPKNAKKL